ncbi:MAG: hypothetical protein M3387_08340 [Actinomycetota bacterium]|nr:hypothetical protein [Actinomycetota bacterium]
MTVLVGGVGQLFQGDLDLGRIAVDRLAGEDLGPGVAVEELHYGAIAVAQRLEELQPDTLVLVGAERRGRVAGTVQRRWLGSPTLGGFDVDATSVQGAVHDAATGYVSIDLILEVGTGFGALPDRTIAIEVEPASVGPAEGLSFSAEQGLVQALDLVRAEVRRAPLFAVAAQLRGLLDGDRLQPAPAVAAMADLLSELELLDREGRWGHTFSARERVRQGIAGGDTPEGMEHLDWALWWTLLEELDRLQPLEGLRD